MAANGDISHSFTDLMTSLAVIFILLLVATLNNMAAESDQTKQDIVNAVAKKLETIGLKIEQDLDDPNTLLVLLGEEKLKFDYNSADLKRESKPLIGTLFSILTPELCDESLHSKIESVIIEGHTDSSGNNTTGGKLHNFKLSQDRAFSVMNEAFVSVAQQKTERLDCLRGIASAIGRGSTRPIKSQPDSASRRVEVKIRVKSGYSISKLTPGSAK